MIEDGIEDKLDFRIHKQDLKLKDGLETEMGALNTIYILFYMDNKFIYVGEVKELGMKFHSASISHFII